MEVSVIIPVFNAEKYISKATESALIQPQVREIILIEDCSIDNSLNICKKLENKYKQVKLFQHPGGINKGAAASRNLGIKHANYKFIAFLDADDYYLENRFNVDEIIFNENPKIDGVYNALGFHYYSSAAKKKYDSMGMQNLTTINAIVEPSEVLNVLLGISKVAQGYFSCDALTVKKSVFTKIKPFNEAYNLFEDTDFIIRLATKCELASGCIAKAVALRGVHDENRVTEKEKNFKHHLPLYKGLYKWGLDNQMPKKALKTCKYYYLSYLSFHSNYFIRLYIFTYVIFNRYNLYRSLFDNIVYNCFGRNKIAYVIFGIRNRFLPMKHYKV